MSFDAFLSYQWDIQESVKSLKHFLQTQRGLKAWLDIDEVDGSQTLFEDFANAIRNSKVLICCVTRSYMQSQFCVDELLFAIAKRKPVIVLMYENVALAELGDVGVAISPLLRINLFEDEQVKQSWSGPKSDALVRALAQFFDGN